MTDSVTKKGCLKIHIDTSFLCEPVRSQEGERSDMDFEKEIVERINELSGSRSPYEVLIPMTVPNIVKTFAETPVSKENALLAEAVGKALAKKMVFQMPDDSEVEA